jgi:DNA repair protein RecO (recombination protein O)
MPLYTADALVLRTYKLGEADRIVVFLTRDRGKKRGVAKGARRPRSRFMGALEPMTRIQVAYFERERRELVSLNYAEVARSPLAAGVAGGSSEALGHVGYFAELLDEWAPENDPNEKLFRLGAGVVEALGSGAAIDALARYFEYWLLTLQGVYPSLRRCQRCGNRLETGGAYVEPRAQTFTCGACAPVERYAAGVPGPNLSPSALRFLRQARTTAPDRVWAITLAPGASRELELVHRALIASHLEKELRSARVLRELR